MLTSPLVIPADYSEQLTYLLRYPASSDNGPLHVSLLLQQAIRLSQEPNTSTGASMVLQNRNILGIPIEVPEPPVRPTSRRRADRSGVQSAKAASHLRESSQSGFPEMIARNLMERGESLGINRAISNTVSELRVRQIIMNPLAATYLFPEKPARSPRGFCAIKFQLISYKPSLPRLPAKPIRE